MTESSLPDAELDVMTCLWKGGAQTARELREMLRDRRPMAHASICTLLKRLESKGLVAREKAPIGKAYVYRARVKAVRTHRRLLGDLLDRVFEGSGIALIASLLETRPPTEDELDQLERLLQAMREKSLQAKKPVRRSP